MRTLIFLISESVVSGLASLLVNKLRTFLSLVGISFGIIAIISVFTIVDALEENVRESIQSLGENVIYIQKWPWAFGSDYPWWKYMNRPNAGISEAQEVIKRSVSAEAVAFMITINSAVLQHGNNSVENSAVICASHEYDRIKSFELSNGRYFTLQESESGANVGIIGHETARSLFPEGSNPLGREVTVKNARIRIIGVFDREGSSIVGNSLDETLLIPVQCARKYIDVRKERFNPMVMVRARTGVSNSEMKEELRGIMRSVRKLHPNEPDNFALNESKLISAGVDGLFQAIGLAGWIIGGFSILVGGFGIANIMFVSVKERTNLIGIQKSLGARNFFILVQFLAESVALCLIGGIIGLLFVFGCTLAVNALLDLEIYLTISNIFLGLAVSAIIGIIAGFVPAWAASSMDPVEAIRTKG